MHPQETSPAILERHLEALVFCSPEPITLEEMKDCLAESFDYEPSEEELGAALESLRLRYEGDAYSFGLERTGGGYRFLTKPAYHEAVGTLLRQRSKKRLSRAALETLTIVAYRQPVTRQEIEQIRGVNADYALRKLLDKGLIEMRGKSDGLGRPTLYGTTRRFLDYFDINGLNELPTLNELSSEAAEIGQPED